MQVRQTRIRDYTYDLPEEKIALHPLPERDASKLLLYRNGQIEADAYRNIARYLDPGSLLVFNNTKVIPARLIFHKPGGGQIEIFCLEPEGELGSGMAQTDACIWKCLVGGIKKWKSGPIVLESGGIRLQAELSDRAREAHLVRFSWQPAALTFSEVLARAGQVPLPPYLKRPVENADLERYQTIYARHDGSVAAPTAGLHFTERVMADLAERGIERAEVALHVGAGTFKPVKSEIVGDHEMHAEYFEVGIDLIRRLATRGDKPLAAVGTTSLRTLESLFLMGSKLLRDPDMAPEALEIRQWDAYEPQHADAGFSDALNALLGRMENRNLNKLVSKTQLLIAPGYRVRSADVLVTNFHQPNSTLLLLVAAFVGADWRRIYEYALKNDFRFLSYGDGMAVWRV
jgi:S-adenosylmethionine:tRNA ribosyltransferase-isomerase